MPQRYNPLALSMTHGRRDDHRRLMAPVIDRPLAVNNRKISLTLSILRLSLYFRYVGDR